MRRDCKIKWGSLVASIKSALDIKPVLVKFLKYSTLELKENDWDVLQELYDVLMPVKAVVDVICRDDADLLQAEVVFTELFSVLESNGSPLSQKLLAALITEIRKRWLPDHVGLLKYLNDHQELAKASKKKPSDGK